MLITITAVTLYDVMGQDCVDLTTPHLPPLGVVSHARYGAPCDERSPCEPGMSCCQNARKKMVCEGMESNEMCMSHSVTWCQTRYP